MWLSVRNYLTSITVILTATTVIAIGLSQLWRVPYVDTFLGAAMLVVVGHVVTIDDDLPGGFSNPDGTVPFLWKGLVIKVAVAALIGFAALVPAIRELGR
jgi:hypothetical protein